jgi:hypothetical protein
MLNYLLLILLMINVAGLLLFVFGGCKVAGQYDQESDEEFAKWIQRKNSVK